MSTTTRMHVAFLYAYGGPRRTERRVPAAPTHRELLASQFERAFPDLDPYGMADDFLGVARRHGRDAHGYAVEQTQADGTTSLATLCR